MDELEQAAREHVHTYLAGGETFDAFESWIVSHGWDAPPGHLTDRIDAAMIYRGIGELDDNEFAEELRTIIGTIRIGPTPPITTGTSSLTFRLTYPR
jgi:hypothetical protein